MYRGCPSSADVISNLRKFSVEVVLTSQITRRPAGHSFTLCARALCENGDDVATCGKCAAGCDACQLVGDIEARLVDGIAVFHEMKMGETAPHTMPGPP